MCSELSQLQRIQDPAVVCYALASTTCGDPKTAICVQPRSSMGNPLAQVQVWCDETAWANGEDPVASKSTCTTSSGLAADLCSSASDPASLCSDTGGSFTGCLARLSSADTASNQAMWLVAGQCTMPDGFPQPLRITTVNYGAPLVTTISHSA